MAEMGAIYREYDLSPKFAVAKTHFIEKVTGTFVVKLLGVDQSVGVVSVLQQVLLVGVSLRFIV